MLDTTIPFFEPDVKPFAKQDAKIYTVTIDENGDLIYLKTNEHDIFAECGEVVTKRASHVEPFNWLDRGLFRFLRLFGDKTRIAEWTRGWKCLWIVDTRPVGGPVLTWGDVWEARGDCQDWMRQMPMYKATALWSNRQSAIDAEIEFLNKFFLERGVQ